MKKILYTIFLRHDTSCKSLTISALSQLLIKILYFVEDFISLDELKKYLQQIINTLPSNDKILAALKELEKEGKLNSKDYTYKIRNNYRKELERSFENRNFRFETVYKKYFKGTDSSEKDIKLWFDEVSIKFFSEYSTEWVYDICGKINDKKYII
ncbi:hypothetical protein JXI42_04505, partial [bacterium]|nr:hypothetical protein [bacterium]